MENTTIIITKLGYYHPSQCNRSYSVFNYVVLSNDGIIDSGNFKTNFGGEDRRIEEKKTQGYNILWNYRAIQATFKNKDIKDIEYVR